MVKISVICTVKNGEAVITPTINSIINQSISSWEFIIIDDGSMDSTPQLLVNFSENYPRIKVFTTEGIGRARALNLAIQKSEGEYIANIDADDPSHPKRLETQLTFMENRKDVSCLVCESLLLKGDQNPHWSIENIETSSTQVKEIDYATLLKRNPINHSSLFIRKSKLEKLGGYNEQRQSLLDYDLWLRLVSNGEKIYKQYDILASKRIHANQSFERKKRLRYLVDTRNLKKSHINKCSASIKYKALAEISVLYGLLPQYVRYLLKKIFVKFSF